MSDTSKSMSVIINSHVMAKFFMRHGAIMIDMNKRPDGSVYYVFDAMTCEPVWALWAESCKQFKQTDAYKARQENKSK